MRSLTLLLLGATAATAQKIVSWDIQKQKASTKALIKAKRATITEAVGNEANLYYANVTVGTPGQLLQLQLDTGSSDVWMTASDAAFCQGSNNACVGGTFDSKQSSTFTVVQQGGFSIQYVDNTGSSGDYFTDAISLGGVTLSEQQMGLATDTTIGTGIIGLGFSSNEAVCTLSPCDTYPSIVEQMVSQKKINSKAYSLWLNDLDSNTGSILFGGVDTNKYMGDLVTLPVLPNSQSEGGNIRSFSVAWTGFGIGTPQGEENNFVASTFNEAAVLDSGTSDATFPDDLAHQLYTQFGAQSDDNAGGYVAPCYLRTSNATLDFTFGGSNGPTIRVGVNEFLLDIPTTTGQTLKDNDGNDLCLVGFEAAAGRPILLGDTFLRSAYVVYDLDNKQVSIAQTIFNSGSANVQEIKAGSKGVPNVASTADSSGASQTASDARSFAVTAQATKTASPTSIGENGKPPLAAFTTAAYHHKAAAAAVGVPLASYEGMLVLGLMSMLALLGSGFILL